MHQLVTGVTAGLRAGYWIDPLPFVGLGLDFFYFSVPIPAQTASATGTLTSEIRGKPITINGAGQADIPSVTLPALGFSPDLRLRWPLITSKEYPQGILQPYLTAGPAWVLTLTSDNVDVKLGGKNMTFYQRVTAIEVGACATSSAPTAAL